ncbi:hypothetical protein [Salinibacter grassmerensis]|uniref:hypothetical protein n=1 Tax=Salinibacter grassmerensis TaxID=3040353 RepID=UPI0021E8E1E0|nr:hypothetical protein [Salinibacter grassmerensis]
MNHMNRYCTAVFALFLTAGLMLPGSALADDPEPADDSTNATSLVANAWESDNTTAAPQQDEPTLDVSVNGSIRFNALFRSYGTALEGGNDRVLGDGGFTFDTFRIGGSGSYGGLIFDSELAVYPESFGGVFLQKGWVGYEFSDARQVQVGVSQVPFGIQPYASSSWFFNSSYYVGLEDDYDAGVKAMFTPGNWDIQGAYYMNAEQTDFFAGQNFSRYSYDVAPNSSANYHVVPGDNRLTEDGEVLTPEDAAENPAVIGNLRSDITEQHQFNVKVGYTFDHGDLGSTKIGVSGQRGQLQNLDTGDTDWHAAYAAHFRGRYAGFDAKLQFSQQELNAPLTQEEKSTFNDLADVNYGAEDFVVMGAYAFPQRVAAEHTVYSSSLAYHIPVNAGPISEIKPYYDFSLVTKNVDAWNDNATHDIGFLTTAGPLFVYTDLNISKGHPFNHPADNFASVMAENNDNEWRTAFNLNIGIYF